MKLVKQLILFLLPAALLCFALPGCGGGDDVDDVPPVINDGADPGEVGNLSEQEDVLPPPP